MQLSHPPLAGLRCMMLAYGLLSGLAQAAELPRLSIGTTSLPSDLSQHLEARLQQAYHQLGYQAAFLPLPSERRLRLVRQQALDADVFRLCTLQNDYPDILVVPVPLGELTLNAFSLDAATLENWQQNTKLLVVHVRGFKMAEQMEFAGTRLEIVSLAQAFALLQQGRVDIVLEDNTSASDFFASTPQWQAINLHSVDLERFSICHILGQHLEHLAEPLRQLLSQPES